MGYETKAYIVERGHELPKGDGIYCSIIGMIDLCKMGESAPERVRNSYALKQESNPHNCYVYADDGNTRILKDMYDAPTVLIPIEDFYEALKSECRKKDKYRRFILMRDTLKSIINNKAFNTEETFVLTFGY